MQGLWRAICAGVLCGCVAVGESLEKVVGGLDAMRLPGRSFHARLEIAEQGRDKSGFRVFACRKGAGFRVMMVCEAPAADAGKRILFADQGTWLHDPRARRSTKLSPRQLWSEGAFVDSLGWVMARDFVATDLGQQRLEVTGGNEGPLCRLLEFKPKAEFPGHAGTIRYWLDDRGWPRQVVHLTAGGRPWRTIHAVEFAKVMGKDRPTVMRVRSRGKVRTITTREQKAMDVPEAWVDPEKFGGVEVK